MLQPITRLKRNNTGVAFFVNHRTVFSQVVVFLLLHVCVIGHGQAYNPVGLKLDESNLAVPSGSSVVADATADGGNAIYRPASAANGTIWYGPYMKLQAGNYLVQFRMKVSSNASSSPLGDLDVTSFSGGVASTVLTITPSSFRNSNEWQLFTLAVQISDNTTNIETRGINFRTGITDVYLDYVNIIPGDARGFYSNEFTVTAKGQVGIGSAPASDNYKLTVNGAALFTRAVVKNYANWPDYVFDSTYQLAPLSSVEQYIQQNKHLPEVPAADSIQRNGVDLAANQAILLKKIEELTLYLLEQDKKITRQQAEIEELKRINANKK